MTVGVLGKNPSRADVEDALGRMLRDRMLGRLDPGQRASMADEGIWRVEARAVLDLLDAIGFEWPTLLCDVEGCEEPVTCGTPTADGYRSTCSRHMRGLKIR